MLNNLNLNRAALDEEGQQQLENVKKCSDSNFADWGREFHSWIF